MATTAPPPASHLSPAGRCVLAAVRADPRPAAAGTHLSTQNVLNLARLAEYLAALPLDYQQFSMEHYMQDGAGYVLCAAQKPECGSVACAVGHGPAAGIPAQPREGWEAYYTRTLLGGRNDYHLWRWMFGGDWSDFDNTPQGAAARITYALQHGAAAVAELLQRSPFMRMAAYEPYEVCPPAPSAE